MSFWQARPRDCPEPYRTAWTVERLITLVLFLPLAVLGMLRLIGIV